MAYQPKSYRKFLVASAAITTAVAGAGAASAASATTFADVKAGSWYAGAVYELTQQGIISGYGDGTFGPQDELTRAQAAKLIAEAKGFNAGSVSNFSDVKANAWYADYVTALAERNIISGYEDGTFKPNKAVTRAEFASMLVNAFGIIGEATLPFTDLTGSWAQDAVEALYANDLTSGVTATTYAPNEEVTRAQTAVFLKRVLDTYVSKDALTIVSGDSKGTSLTNGEKKVYQVKIYNPTTGNPVTNQPIQISFKENMDVNYVQTRATVTDARGNTVVPYQLNNGEGKSLTVYTDNKGVATFTVSGTNTTATPVAYLDGTLKSEFYENGFVYRDNGQYEDNFYNQNKYFYDNGRFDAGELVAFASTVKFDATQATFEWTPEQDGEAVVGIDNGRKYVVTVRGNDGELLKNGNVNIALNEIIDGSLYTDTEALIAVYTDKGFDTIKDNMQGLQQFTKVRTDSNGKVYFKVYSNDTSVDDIATPFVWVDRNSPNLVTENGKFDNGEPSALLPTTYFANPYVTSADLSVNSSTNTFSFKTLNQSGNAYIDAGLDADVTFEVRNTGSTTVQLGSVAGFANGLLPVDSNSLTIEVGGKLTVRGTMTGNTVSFDVTAINDDEGSVVVSASAVTYESGTDSRHNNKYFDGGSEELTWNNEVTSFTGYVTNITGTNFDLYIDGNNNGQYDVGETIRTGISMDDADAKLYYLTSSTTVTEEFFASKLSENDLVTWTKMGDSKDEIDLIQDGTAGGSSNIAPTVVNPIADQTATVGGSLASIDLSTVFTDANGNALTYTATSSDATVADTTVGGNTLNLTVGAAGTTDITVTANDGSLTVTDTFTVTVNPAGSVVISNLDAKATLGVFVSVTGNVTGVTSKSDITVTVAGAPATVKSYDATTGDFVAEGAGSAGNEVVVTAGGTTAKTTVK